MAKVRVAIAGCGSVSGPYLEDLTRSPYVEIVAVCDIRLERAEARAQEFGVPNRENSLAALLQRTDFDLLLNLTSMPSHFAINKQALEAGKHVWSEKPFGHSLAEAQELMALAEAQDVRFLAAPTTVLSPAFRCMAEIIGSGRVGKVHVARASYGHSGPGWGPWFYQKGGGSLFDLGVYNITTLTGLLGPAKAVTALSGVAVAEREVEGERVRVEADDNMALLLDHGDAVFSSISTGFVYGKHREERTIDLIGTQGGVSMLGWDWLPTGVEAWSAERQTWEVLCEDREGYSWERGGSYFAECLATGKTSLLTIEHAYHVLEVMLAAHESAATGRRVDIASQFPFPLIETKKQTAVRAPQGLDPDKHTR